MGDQSTSGQIREIDGDGEEEKDDEPLKCGSGTARTKPDSLALGSGNSLAALPSPR